MAFLWKGKNVSDVMDTQWINLSYPHFQFDLVLSFEQQFDSVEWIRFHRKYKYFAHICIIIYSIVIFFLHQWMKERPRMRIVYAVIIWDLLLSFLNLVIVLRILPDFVYDLWHYGFLNSLCDSSWLLLNPVSGFWFAVFLYSKVIELGDTVILVLRKRPLTFLHVFHHISVVWGSFYLITDQVGPARWAPMINGNIHVIMYIYFAVKVYGFACPIWVSMSITTVQILQMLFGIFVAVQMNAILDNGGYCAMEKGGNYLIFVLAVSYAILFCNYFFQTYIKKKQKGEKVNSYA